jgi:acyl-coenzyme A thioesterase 1/2/4
VYAVEKVRDGKNFATRFVRATQDGSCVFLTTVGFTRDDGSEGETKKVVRHAKGMSERVRVPRIEDQMSEVDPMILCTPEVVGWEKEVADRKVRWWIRARGSIEGSGQERRQRHVAAVAFMTDNMFIEAVALVHGLVRPWRESCNSSKLKSKIQGIESREEGEMPPVGMMVSLSHTIHFHESRGFRADDWLLLESNSPWAAHERGVVMQRVYTRDGKLIASCYQEVSKIVVRLLNGYNMDNLLTMI